MATRRKDYDSQDHDSSRNHPANRLTRKWTLSNDGELIIDMYIDNPNGSFETKRVFKKK